ncbi:MULTISPECIES: pyrroline-5-carboxylate reductase [unclassified Agrobacterium]|uniref:pyrroline-5-carboxylate reductase n=1 Tax=unclassified Agrobacterium TaxID=2632611 RepID=UPI002449B04E|nr:MULTISPECIES: pyrroline-5-carboxylate reductase [unclassified Agrobacterium]MDH0614898.1 pyrroline-5-carboxylate reductase [Agrobacterium sp. GD03872]MDH0699558.1 pyrroline-5-carboxylate reductase [Agrobacterium sp. GD03871]MDH1061960.1 pyrroline-5-carboxylate reductase [Agrobacterium sp. GD03992]MDH2211668.1 pyrroline-5-carboxylate reductase [Agrobacterium sp. GD03643]MDH2220360.1 pyrroline-5-carboxylate reductase [Agrobacterium sp. GD03638]
MSLPQKIGFIGTGAITEAMVRGLLGRPAALPHVMVSQRSADISARLAVEFPQVVVSGDNQAIVDGCDTVVLAIRPQIAEEVIRPLQFRDGQKIISVVAATGREALLDWIGADVRLSQAIPLPFVARRSGVTAIYPADVDTAAIFNVLGKAVECETKAEYDLLAAASALMATYFGIMQTATEWLAEKGLPEEKARAYLTPLFAGLSEVAVLAGDRTDFTEISREFATKGGLNEQVLQDFDGKGGSRVLKDALSRVLERIGQ